MECLKIIAKSFQIGEIKIPEIEFIYLFEAKTHYFAPMMSFLKADWRKLAIANYEIDPAVLTKFIPAKTELDLWDGRCYVSLVGFMFLNTRLLGLPIPFHQNFEEVNLRFYVRHKQNNKWKRGVVFIKEIVPKSALTFVANTIYKEHYQTMKMSHSWKKFKDYRTVQYNWMLNGNMNSLFVKATRDSSVIEEKTETEFITEHYWGYTKSDKLTFEYEVTHPSWECYEVIEHQIKVDFGKIYGIEFTELTNREPISVMLAEGSEIAVENKRKI